MSEVKAHWQELAALSTSHDRHQIGLVDESTLLVNSYDELWCYDCTGDTWEKLKKCDDMDLMHQTISINTHTLKVYIFGDNGYIYCIQLKNDGGSWSSLGIVNKSNNHYHDGSHTASLIIDGQFHIFGGWNPQYKSHFIWNEDKQDLLEIHKFDDIDCSNSYQNALHYHSVVYLKSKNCLLILTEDTNKMYSYSLETNEASLLSLELPVIHTCHTGVVITRNEQYLIIFSPKDKQEIWIIDLNINEIRKSDIKCKHTSVAMVVLRDDLSKSRIIAFGFIRQCWNLKEFSKTRYPEKEIIIMIMTYLVQEIIHVLRPGKHYCINADDIINFSHKV